MHVFLAIIKAGSAFTSPFPFPVADSEEELSTSLPLRVLAAEVLFWFRPIRKECLLGVLNIMLPQATLLLHCTMEGTFVRGAVVTLQCDSGITHFFGLFPTFVLTPHSHYGI